MRKDKFRFAVSSVISESNINLAFLEDIKFTSADVVKVTKYTNLYDDNIIPIFSDFTKASVDDNGNINVFNKTDDFLITNETIIDEESLDLLPLWYVHNVKKPYMNITESSRDLKVNIDGNIIDNLIPSGSNMKVINNSVTMYYSVDAGNVYSYLPTQYYKVDVANDRIIITDQALLDAAEGYYRVQYSVIVPDIVIRDNYGNIINNTKYVPEINIIEGTTGLYNVNILTWFSNTDDIVYYVDYSTLENQQQVDESEILRVYPLYKRASSKDAIIDRNDRRIAITDDYTVQSHLTIFDTVYLKYTIENNEYIEIKAPENMPKNISWYIDIRAGRFRSSENNLVYDVVEKNKYMLKNNQKVSNAVVEPIFISDTVVKLYHKNLYVSIDNEGNYTNMFFYVDGIDKTDLIDDIDIDNGILYLKDVISAYRDVSVSYYYRSKYVPYEYLNVNPLKKYTDNEDIILKNVIMYMLPKDYLNLSLNRSIFHKIVYKHPGSVKDVRPEEINVSKCISYILGTDETGKSNIYDEVSDYLSANAADDLQPIILGVINTSQILHPDRYDFIDIRNESLYLSDVYELADLLKINRDILNYADIGRYDGEPIYGDKVVIVRIPKRLQDKIQTLFETFDTETVRKTKFQSDYPIVRMREYITGVLKKYFKVGLYFKIYFEDE